PGVGGLIQSQRRKIAEVIVVRDAANVETCMQATTQCLLMLNSVIPPVAVGRAVIVKISALQRAHVALAQVTELRTHLQTTLGKNARRESQIVIRCQVEIIRKRKFHAARGRST